MVPVLAFLSPTTPPVVLPILLLFLLEFLGGEAGVVGAAPTTATIPVPLPPATTAQLPASWTRTLLPSKGRSPATSLTQSTRPSSATIPLPPMTTAGERGRGTGGRGGGTGGRTNTTSLQWITGTAPQTHSLSIELPVLAPPLMAKDPLSLVAIFAAKSTTTTTTSPGTSSSSGGAVSTTPLPLSVVSLGTLLAVLCVFLNYGGSYMVRDPLIALLGSARLCELYCALALADCPTLHLSAPVVSWAMLPLQWLFVFPLTVPVSIASSNSLTLDGSGVGITYDQSRNNVFLEQKVGRILAGCWLALLLNLPVPFLLGLLYNRATGGSGGGHSNNSHRSHLQRIRDRVPSSTICVSGALLVVSGASFLQIAVWQGLLLLVFHPLLPFSWMDYIPLLLAAAAITGMTLRVLWVAVSEGPRRARVTVLKSDAGLFVGQLESITLKGKSLEDLEEELEGREGIAPGAVEQWGGVQWGPYVELYGWLLSSNRLFPGHSLLSRHIALVELSIAYGCSLFTFTSSLADCMTRGVLVMVCCIALLLYHLMTRPLRSRIHLAFAIVHSLLLLLCSGASTSLCRDGDEEPRTSSRFAAKLLALSGLATLVVIAAFPLVFIYKRKFSTTAASSSSFSPPSGAASPLATEGTTMAEAGKMLTTNTHSLSSSSNNKITTKALREAERKVVTLTEIWETKLATDIDLVYSDVEQAVFDQYTHYEQQLEDREEEFLELSEGVPPATHQRVIRDPATGRLVPLTLAGEAFLQMNPSPEINKEEEGVGAGEEPSFFLDDVLDSMDAKIEYEMTFASVLGCYNTNRTHEQLPQRADTNNGGDDDDSSGRKKNKEKEEESTSASTGPLDGIPLLRRPAAVAFMEREAEEFYEAQLRKVLVAGEKLLRDRKQWYERQLSCWDKAIESVYKTLEKNEQADLRKRFSKQDEQQRLKKREEAIGNAMPAFGTKIECGLAQLAGAFASKRSERKLLSSLRRQRFFQNDHTTAAAACLDPLSSSPGTARSTSPQKHLHGETLDKKGQFQQPLLQLPLLLQQRNRYEEREEEDPINLPLEERSTPFHLLLSPFSCRSQQQQPLPSSRGAGVVLTLNPDPAEVEEALLAPSARGHTHLASPQHHSKPRQHSAALFTSGGAQSPKWRIEDGEEQELFPITSTVLGNNAHSSSPANRHGRLSNGGSPLTPAQSLLLRSSHSPTTSDYVLAKLAIKKRRNKQLLC